MNCLREITGEDFTAKDFRTWAGTLVALQTLAGVEQYTSKTGAKKNILAAIKAVLHTPHSAGGLQRGLSVSALQHPRGELFAPVSTGIPALVPTSPPGS